MKKTLCLFCAALLFGAVLTACGKKTAKIDLSGWVTDIDAGLEAAKKADKRVILLFSADEDASSRALKDKLQETEDFLAAETERYVLINLDFSASRYEKAMSAMTSETEPTKKEQQAALEAQAALTRDMKQAMYLAANASPSFYVLTKDGYPAASFQLDEEAASLTDFEDALAPLEEDIAAYEALVTAIDAAKGVEKARAIDALFEATTAEWRYLLLPLCQQMQGLDPKNETGLLGKHLLALANGKATDAFLQQDLPQAAGAFAEVAANELLNADEKQEAYYTAAYLLAQGGSTDYAAIRSFAQQAYDAAPESDHADMVRAFIGQVDQQIAAVEEMQKNVDITADEGYTSVNPAAAE